ncbi:Uncharacterized protein OBRU01_09929 [Operophtera brumata]|uniref:MADF domain-containing protein n=1 Tax=Operophtera brumata TaxID=104452 RepID=A0A0L7LF27_OPEBR|nr:Uncharacterized protein OBRU01_09929 [Operophtera brumata]
MKRHQAITQLSQLVQTYDPAATRVHILRKIDSLRACVRREYKKVKESRLLATCEEEIYVPTLWYYHLFSFLMEHEDNKGKVEVLRARPHSPELIAVSILS